MTYLMSYVLVSTVSEVVVLCSKRQPMCSSCSYLQVGDLYSELVPQTTLFVQSALGVVKLSLQRRLGLGQRGVAAVQVLDLSLQLEVLLRQASLQATCQHV